MKPFHELGKYAINGNIIQSNQTYTQYYINLVLSKLFVLV